MALIRITDDDERRLERVAPYYLKGDRRSTQRVRWAIDEVVKHTATAETSSTKSEGETDGRV